MPPTPHSSPLPSTSSGQASLLKKTYALLIGINEYRRDIRLMEDQVFPKLTGCVPDVTAFAEWLNKQEDIDLQLEELHNEAATKAAIIKGIQTHLAKASKDDVVLFYFAGHGTIEYADPTLWPSDTDGRLECLVPYYSDSDSTKFLLADKELRYLFRELWTKTQAHIVSIYDCCHSGDNMRSQSADHPIVARRSFDGVVFPQREWGDFLFAKTLSASEVQQKAIDEVLPPGHFMQLYAAKSNEVALESGGRGVFSQALLHVLQRAEHHLSYETIFQRIKNRLRNRYGQQPGFYTPPAAAILSRMGFLGREVGTEQAQAFMSYNGGKNAYYLNRGSIHGIQNGMSQLSISLEDGSLLHTTVAETGIDAAKVKLDGTQMTRLAQKDYLVHLENVKPDRMALFLKNHSADDTVFDTFLDQLDQDLNAPAISWEEEEEEAEFVLHFAEDQYYWTYPKENWRPITKPQNRTDSGLINLQIDLIHIYRWRNLYHLQADKTVALPQNAIEISCALADDNGPFQEILMEKHAIEVGLLPPDNRRKCQIKIRNNYHQDLHVAAVILSFDFSGMPFYLLDPSVALLEVGEEKTLRDHKASKSMTFRLDERCLWYNWPSSTDRILFLASTDGFTTSIFDLPALPPPHMPDGKLRAGRKEIKKNDISLLEWISIPLDITVINPLYNHLTDNAKDLMKNHPSTAVFGQGLYG